MSYEDAWNDPDMRRWVDHVLSDMKPKMEASALVMQIVPSNYGDVKLWVELGASIMMDKPIIAVEVEGRQAPAKLRAIADEVVVLPRGVTPQASSELAAAVRRVTGR